MAMLPFSNPHIMSRGHKIRAKGQRVLEQKCPADLSVADQAWIRRLAARVSIQEILHNSFLKYVFCINHIKGDIEFCSHATRLCHRIRRAAAVGIFLAWLTP